MINLSWSFEFFVNFLWSKFQPDVPKQGYTARIFFISNQFVYKQRQEFRFRKFEYSQRYVRYPMLPEIGNLVEYLLKLRQSLFRRFYDVRPSYFITCIRSCIRCQVETLQHRPNCNGCHKDIYFSLNDRYFCFNNITIN